MAFCFEKQAFCQVDKIMQTESCKIYERYSSTPSESAKSLFYYPQWAGRFLCKDDFYIERESFESILIICTEKGSGILNYRGEKYILNEKNYAIINCNEKHTYYPCSESEWEFIFLHLNGNNCLALYEHIYAAGGCVFKAKKTVFDSVKDCISNCKNKSGSYEWLCSKKISDIFYETLESCTNAESNGISEVCAYIAKNYSKNISTDSLAEMCGFSRAYFSTLFKKATGRSPHDYIICYRLDKAKELLIKGERSVSEIAELTGFFDLGTFIRAFKKKEGITPLKYKNK